jgi:hypothetical protein
MYERTPRRLFPAAFLAVLAVNAIAASDWFGNAPEQAYEALGVAELMADPDARVNQRLAVTGRVTDVCTNRGCWAVIEGGGAMLRIVARDHAFAMPSDLREDVLAHGVFERHEISPEAAEHMVEEDGADAALLADPVSYRLVADGVRVAP